ncbi:MFS transporter, ACS family, D-galactonate transporter [Megasphaera paucivorans]|uniref:MFS transporter, ACS family, D-galactonate transporter n=1 Tax=Megasphaera paucivorans TaxID=349095 RepID=A0A1H0BJ13_9FIRM|nr:MFS transporter [Megasphaera paucivorans]SDN45654.1 MFS transporter, ACS family, D-galactonate transporter [Megasphaera paucivorans]
MSSLTDKPTRIRWQVFISIFILCSINYVDRAVISVLMPSIQADLQFSPEMVGIILSAFFWGYVLMQIPSGWLCDKFSPGKIIVGTGCLWGAFQIVTGFVTSSTAFITIRSLLGMSEAPIYPAGGKLQSVWLTNTERGKGAALLDSGSAVGNAIGAPLCALFVAWLDGWRGALMAAGVLTIIVVLACRNLVSETPESNPHVNEAEREYLRKAFAEEDSASLNNNDSKASGHVFAKYLKSRSFWGLCLGFAAYDSFWYGLMTWGALYLAATQHLDIKGLGWAIFVIYMIGVGGEFLGGTLTDHWRKQSSKNSNSVMHKLFPILGICIAVPMYLLCTVHSVYFAVFLMSVSMFFEKWCGSLYWSLPAIVTDRQHSGAVSGAMNLWGNVGGAVIPIVVGFIVGVTGSYYWALILFVVLAVLLGLFPLIIDFNKKIGVN